MYIKNIIAKAFNTYFDFKSFNTGRKILVIESDDWGSFRTKNNKILKELNKINSDISKDLYSQLDTIASTEDLRALFEVLESVNDKNGNPACITFNTCMANPNYEKIRRNDFLNFYYTPFYDSIIKSGGVELWNLWEEGISNTFIRPQLHGREHLHALQWLEELRAGNQELLKAFDLESFGIPYQPLLSKRRKNLQAALDYYGLEGEKQFQENWLEESAILFEKTFGFKSKTFIPTAYIWHSALDIIMQKQGIEAYQGIKLQYQPKAKGYKKLPHYIGQNKNNLRYLVRNAFFEPSFDPHKDWVDATLSDIRKAFDKNQPVIIGSHRVNYIGSLKEKNRTHNLRLLKEILFKVTEMYPDVEFMDSGELVETIKNNQYYNFDI